MINCLLKRQNRRAVAQAFTISAFAATTLMSAVFVTAGPTGAWASGLDDIKARGHMAIATEDDFNPSEFIKDGVSTGYDNEQCNEV